MTNLQKRETLLPFWNRNLFDVDRFFGPIGKRFFDEDASAWGLEKTVPAVNIKENDKDYVIEMAVPGMEKKDFKVEVDDGMLTISSEKEEEKTEEKKNYTRKEYAFNSFSRSFTLPEHSDAENMQAKYENGILQIQLPKKEVTITKKSKEIKVS